MKRLLIIISVISAMCSYGSNPNFNQKEWVSIDKVSVIAQLKNKEYSKSETINLKITIFNNSKSVIKLLLLGNPLKDFNIIIKDKGKNKTIPLTSKGKKLINTTVYWKAQFPLMVKKTEYYVYDDINLKEYFALENNSSYSLSIEGGYHDNNNKIIKYKIDGLEFSIK